MSLRYHFANWSTNVARRKQAIKHICRRFSPRNKKRFKNKFGYTVIRLYIRIMKAIETQPQKRRQRAYKATDGFYDKAKKKADKGTTSLAGLIENFVIMYAKGFDITYTKK